MRLYIKEKQRTAFTILATSVAAVAFNLPNNNIIITTDRDMIDVTYIICRQISVSHNHNTDNPYTDHQHNDHQEGKPADPCIQRGHPRLAHPENSFQWILK